MLGSRFSLALGVSLHGSESAGIAESAPGQVDEVQWVCAYSVASFVTVLRRAL